MSQQAEVKALIKRAQEIIAGNKQQQDEAAANGIYPVNASELFPEGTKLVNALQGAVGAVEWAIRMAKKDPAAGAQIIHDLERALAILLFAYEWAEDPYITVDDYRKMTQPGPATIKHLREARRMKESEGEDERE